MRRGIFVKFVFFFLNVILFTKYIGDDDSQNDIRTSSQESVSQSGSESTVQPEVSLASQSEPASSSTASEHHSASCQFSSVSDGSNPQSVEYLGTQRLEAEETKDAISRSSEIRELPTSLPSTSSYSNETLNKFSDITPGSGTNELRRRRLAFYDKSANFGAKVTDTPHSFTHIPHDPSPAPTGGDCLPVHGSNGDPSRTSDNTQESSTHENQSLNTDDSTASAQTNIEESLPVGYMRVKIKYLDDRQRQVDVAPNETIGEFKR